MSENLSAESDASSSNGDESDVSESQPATPVRKQGRQQKSAEQGPEVALQTQICATPRSGLAKAKAARTPANSSGARRTPRSQAARRTPPSSKGRSAKAKLQERQGRGSGSKGAEALVKVKCLHCAADTDITKAYKRGNKYSCSLCNGARIALQNHHRETGKWETWKAMPKMEKDNLIAQNRHRSLGKGKKFPVKCEEKATVQDSVGLRKTKNFVNYLEYRRECKKRWGMKKEECKERWLTLLGDKSIPRMKDQMNWTTMPALSVFQQTGERKLSHSRSTTKKSVEMTDALGLHDVARECFTGGTMQRDTGLFKESCLEDFFSAPILEAEEAVVLKVAKAKGKAKAKAKAKALGAGHAEDSPERPPKRPRHRDAERDCARIAALRARRQAVDSMVKECSDSCDAVAKAMAMTSEESVSKELRENRGLVMKSLARLWLSLPTEATEAIDERERSGSDKIAYVRLKEQLKASLEDRTKESKERSDPAPSPQTADKLKEAFDNDDDLTAKKVQTWLKNSRAHAAAVSVTVLALEEEFRRLQEAGQAQAQGDGEPSGNATAHEGEEEAEVEQDPEIFPSPHSWPLLEVLSSSGMANNVRVVPAAPAADTCELVPRGTEARRALLYDGWDLAALTPECKEEFTTFAKATEFLPPPHRSKVQGRGYPTMSDCLRSTSSAARAPTDADVALLNSSFWAAERMRASGSDFYRSLGRRGKDLEMCRVFAQRWQVCKPEFELVGVNEMLLPKMVVCHEGIRFVAGVCAEKLLDYVESKDAVNRAEDDPWQRSFLQLLSRLPCLDPEEFSTLDGFFVMLKPSQALEIPGGYIIAETCLSTSCVVSTWSCVRQEDVQEGATWTHSLGRLRRLVWEDQNDKTEYAPRLKAENDKYLARQALLLDALEDLLKWLQRAPPALAEDVHTMQQPVADAPGQALGEAAAEATETVQSTNQDSSRQVQAPDADANGAKVHGEAGEAQAAEASKTAQATNQDPGPGRQQTEANDRTAVALAVTDALNEIYENLDSGLPPSPSKTIRWGELMAVLGVSSTIMEELSEMLQDALHEDDEEVWHLNCATAMKIITDYGRGNGGGQDESETAPTVELGDAAMENQPQPHPVTVAVVPAGNLQPVKPEPAVQPTLAERESTPQVYQVDSSPSPSPARLVPSPAPPPSVAAKRVNGKQSPTLVPGAAPVGQEPSESEKALTELRSRIAAKAAQKMYEDDEADKPKPVKPAERAAKSKTSQSQGPRGGRARGGRGRAQARGRGKAKAKAVTLQHDDEDSDEEHDEHATPPRGSKRK